MKRKILIGVVIAVFLLCCTQPPEQMELSAEQIVKQMEEGYKSLKDVKGTLVGTTNGANHSIMLCDEE